MVTGKAIDLVKKTYAKDCFLLVGKQEIIPVSKIETITNKLCEDSRVNFISACSNDQYYLNSNKAKDWFERGVKSITITEAVEMGWRVFCMEYWIGRATPKMKAEYNLAIERIIANLPEVEKQRFLKMAIAYPNG